MKLRLVSSLICQTKKFGCNTLQTAEEAGLPSSMVGIPLHLVVFHGITGINNLWQFQLELEQLLPSFVGTSLPTRALVVITGALRMYLFLQLFQLPLILGPGILAMVVLLFLDKMSIIPSQISKATIPTRSL